MSLTATDKQEIREIVTDTVVAALEDIVIPRFERLENRMDNLEDRMGNLEDQMGSLETRMDKQEGETNDLRSEMRAGFASVNKRIDDLDDKLSGKVEAVENDIKELYAMVAILQNVSMPDKKFAKLSLEQKILQTHAEVVALARQAGVKLSL